MNSNALNLNVSLAGRFRFRKGVINKDGSETITGETPWFNNRILNNGLNQMGRAPNDDLIMACQVGTGSATVDDGQTTLDNRIATTTNKLSNSIGMVVGPPRYGRRTVVFRFAQGVAAGNLTEVGISYQTSTTGLLFSRALIQDALGSPTVLTILATEFLDVEYEIRLYVPTGSQTATITVGGVSTTVTFKVAENGSQTYWAEYIPTLVTASTAIRYNAVYTGALGAENAAPSGFIQGKTNATSLGSYTDNNYYLDLATTWGITEGNGTIRSALQRTSLGVFQFEYSPTIPKDNTKQMILRYRLSWSRYSP